MEGKAKSSELPRHNPRLARQMVGTSYYIHTSQLGSCSRVCALFCKGSSCRLGMVDKNDTLPSSVSTVNERWCGDSLIPPHRGRQAMDRTVIYTLPRNVHIEPGLVGVLLPGVLGSGKLRREGTSRGGLLLACGYFPPGLCFRVSDRDARGVNLSCLAVIRAAVTAGSPLQTDRAELGTWTGAALCERGTMWESVMLNIGRG
ncbi:hypothetical protein EDB80DRAFT_322668 [Ilyonectria destructans]|nr:hypothetical protein EDB80DRAFT_322668 [Ilyonectria destructans]